MAAQLTSEEMLRFSNQIHELEVRVLRGSLSLAQVRPALQDVIDGKFDASPSVAQSVIRGSIIDLSSHFDPQRAIDRMRALCKERGKTNGWQFTVKADFSKLPDPPAWPTEAKLPAIVLCANLGNVGNTFNEACIAAKSRQPQQWEHPLDLEQLSLRFAEFAPHTLWWEVIDLAANWEPEAGRRVRDLTDPNLAHVQCLWAADQYPEAWVQAQDGSKVPYVDMAGYSYSEGYVPCCLWRSGNLGLSVDYDGVDGLAQGYAAPLALRDSM